MRWQSWCGLWAGQWRVAPGRDDMHWLRDGDTILVAWAERCSGPGWSNTPVRVLVQDRYHALRIEWIQPDDQDAVCTGLHAISAAAAESMTASVRRLVGGRDDDGK